MSKPDDSKQTSDPFELWRQLYDANERSWSSALEQTMGRPEFSESSGKLLEALLAAQKATRDNMRTYLETINVPTREDIARLGELVVGLEEKVDQVGDRLDAIEKAVRARPPSPAGTPSSAKAPSAARMPSSAKAPSAAGTPSSSKAASRAKAPTRAKTPRRAS